MTVWTISAQEGTGGGRLAAELAAAAQVPLFDRAALGRLAHEADPALPETGDLEARFSRFTMLSLSAALSAGSVEAFQEVELRHNFPTLGRAILGEAARSPCVLYLPAAFAVLRDHPAAIHVRAVKRPEVVDVQAIVATDDQSVIARHGHVVQEDRSIRRAPDAHPVAVHGEAFAGTAAT